MILIAAWAFSLISQLGLHFWPAFSYVGGLPIDYLSLAIYFGELTTAILVARSFFWLRKQKTASWFWLAIAFVVLNILIAASPVLAFQFWLRLLLLLGLVLVVLRFKNREVVSVKKGFSLALIFLAVLMMGQLLLQHSLGGFWYWLGERELGLATPGVAKLVLGGVTLIRPYGTFSHPNSLAGFLLVTLVILRNIRRVGQWTLANNLLWWGGWVLVLLTGSRAVLVASLIYLVLLALTRLKVDWPRWAIAAVIIVSVITTGAFLVIRVDSGGEQSLNQRLVLAQTAMETAVKHPVFGVGLGNSIKAVYQESVTYRFNLWYQPVHNVWLLLLLEVGLVGFFVVAVLVVKFLRKLVRAREYGWLAGWMSVLATVLFDHYWLTLPQNRLVMALLLGLTLRSLVGQKRLK